MREHYSILNTGIRKFAHQEFAFEKPFSQTYTDVESQPEQLLYENIFIFPTSASAF